MSAIDAGRKVNTRGGGLAKASAGLSPPLKQTNQASSYSALRKAKNLRAKTWQSGRQCPALQILKLILGLTGKTAEDPTNFKNTAQ